MVLAKFPWYSAAVCSSDDLFAVANDFFKVRKLLQCYFQLTVLLQNFASSVKNYESNLLSARTLSEVTIQRGLGIGIGGEVTSWHPSANLAPVECSKICSVISAYRLLDVVAMLSGAPCAPPVERRFFEVPNTSFRVGATL